MKHRPVDVSRPDGESTASVSRRNFLRGAGTTALGATAVVTGAHSAAHAAGSFVEEFQPQPLPANFGRIFPGLPPFYDEANEALADALIDITKPGGILDANDDLARGPIDLITDLSLSENNLNNASHTAGTTFMGQFLDHDMTFDTTSPLGVPTPPEISPNARTPSLDLDSLYGGGPMAAPQLYESDRTKMRIESGGLFEDLPRDSNGTAIISDPRNDENLMLSGLQAAFIMFHNAVVDFLREQPQPTFTAGPVGRTVPMGTFGQARLLVTRHYQWITVHEYLPQILGQSVVDRVFRPRGGRRFYRPSTTAFIPVEFNSSAYRFGHSMVRPSYRANLAGDNGEPFFGFIFDPAGEGQADPVDLRGHARAPRRFIGWQTFFDFGDGEVKPNKTIDTTLSTPLFNLPLSTIPTRDAPTSLATRNLLRHVTWELPSGQSIAQAMGVEPLSAADLDELSGYGLGLETSTPLWYYILKEAELVADGLTLGPVGGTIVGEVFAGCLQLDRNSYLNQRGWRPTLPTRSGEVTGDFSMVDLLTFAGVDPTSRGQ